MTEYYGNLRRNTGVSKAVVDSLGGLVDSIKPLEQSLKQHEMRPFEIEPNYREDLLRSRGKLPRNSSPDFDETKSEMLKKIVNQHSRGGNNLKNSKIISASPFRAVIRQMPGV